MKSCPTCHSSFSPGVEICPEDGTPLHDSDSWLPGTTIRGKYVIFSKIAESRSSAVYKARDLARDEPRAIKSLRADLAQDPALVKRFKSESLVMRRLRHENCPRVETSDQCENGRPFLVMEYIEGHTLERVLKEEGRLAVPRACSIAKQIAAALDTAHSLGIVHGDLSPASVVLARQPGREIVKVLGFGGERLRELCLGKHRLNGAKRQFQDFVPAAAEYASPEGAAGKRGDELDGRADLYSLGILMYEMLAGTPPFRGFSSDATLEVLLAQIEAQPDPLRAAGADVPEELAAIVARLLEKRRELRTATARLLIEEIERAEKDVEAVTSATVSEPQSAESKIEVEEPAMAITPTPPIAPKELVPEPPLPLAPSDPGQVRIERYPVHSILFRTPESRKRHVRGWWVAVPAIAVALGIVGWLAFSIYRPSAANDLRLELTHRLRAFGGPSSSAKAAPARSTIDGAAASPAGNSATPQAHQEPGTAGTSEAVPSRDVPSAGRAAEPRHVPPEHRATAEPPRSSIAAQPAVSAAEVRRVLAEGDSLFGRGEYDRAVLVYEGPLKLDPTISVLRQRIERARKAKAAEEKYLPQ